MIFAMIIGVIISIGLYVLFLLFRHLINLKLVEIEDMRLNKSIRQLARIRNPFDGCPICGNELFFSTSNIYMMRGAWYYKYFCSKCGKDTAIMVLTEEEHDRFK